MNSLQVLASTSSEKPGLFEALGIDWKLLLLQSIAFLIMLYVLKRFVYPPLTRALDERQKTVEAGLQAAKDAEAKAQKSQQEIEELLKTARKEASAIVATARSEAAASVESAEEKAKARAKRIADQAHEQIEQDVLAARKALKHDTIELVALATEKIINQKMDPAKDKKVIEASLQEAK